MSNSPFKQIFLPSILVSTLVFTGFTLSFVLREPNASAAEFNPSDGLMNHLSDEYKSSVIRYVGLTIIASVGSGVATVEALRKLQSLRESMQAKKQRPNRRALTQREPQMQLPEVESSTVDTDQVTLLDKILELESFGQPSLVEPDLTDVDADENGNVEVEAIATPTLPTELDIYALTDLFTSEMSEGTDVHMEAAVALQPRNLQPFNQFLVAQSDWFSPLQPKNSEHLNSSVQVLCALPQRQNCLDNPILELDHPYQTCRIAVHASNERQFALAFDGQYYRFTRLEKTREQALRSARRLAKRVSQVAVTESKNGYAVWVLEPNAVPESMV